MQKMIHIRNPGKMSWTAPDNSKKYANRRRWTTPMRGVPKPSSYKRSGDQHILICIFNTRFENSYIIIYINDMMCIYIYIYIDKHLNKTPIYILYIIKHVMQFLGYTGAFFSPLHPYCWSLG